MLAPPRADPDQRAHKTVQKVKPNRRGGVSSVAIAALLQWRRTPGRRGSHMIFICLCCTFSHSPLQPPVKHRNFECDVSGVFVEFTVSIHVFYAQIQNVHENRRMQTNDWNVVKRELASRGRLLWWETLYRLKQKQLRSLCKKQDGSD